MYRLDEYDDALGADCAPWSGFRAERLETMDDFLDGEEQPLPQRRFDATRDDSDMDLDLDFTGDAGRRAGLRTVNGEYA